MSESLTSINAQTQSQGCDGTHEQVVQETGNTEPGVVEVPATPTASRSSSPSSDLRLLHGNNWDPSNAEKGMPKLTGKYVKYAGEHPDGGLKAWSVLLAFGFINTWGIFQAYYKEILLPDSSPSDIAWIGSLQYALVLLPGLVTGRLFDLGYFKVPYFIASCVLVACTFLIAECTEYWQFFLAQGLGVGLASGVLCGPAPAVVSHWFSRRRGLALSIIAAGSSIGGTIFPIVGQNLLLVVGFKWTMRIFGFILILLLGVTNLTIDRRLPPMSVKGGLFNSAAFKNPAYTIYCFSGLTCFLGLYTTLTYIPASAVQIGISKDFAFYLVGIANGASGFGRLTAGLLADRMGALNIIIPFTTVTSITTFAWPYATSKGSLIAIAVIYGFASGGFLSLLSAPAMAMGTLGDVGRRTGMFLSIAAMGALMGPPISGAIDSATDGFEDVGWYAGGILLFSVVLLLLTKYLHLGKLTGRF